MKHYIKNLGDFLSVTRHLPLDTPILSVDEDWMYDDGIFVLEVDMDDNILMRQLPFTAREKK